jgi:hypothetical protein
MDTELDPWGIVQIAEEIEYRRIRWYERIIPSCADAASRNLCPELLAWSRRQVTWRTDLGARLRTGVPFDTTTYPGDSLASSARIMAALAFFVAETSAPELPAVVTCGWMLTDAVNRARQAIIFYEGLRGFTHDRIAKEVMDEIVQREKDHLREMLLQLEPYKQARCKGGPYLACVC